MSTRRRDPRRKARESALQILYLWEVSGTPVASAGQVFFSEQWPDSTPPPSDVVEFASALAIETVDRLAAIDELIAETVERWRPERMAIVDRLIIRMAVCELLRESGTPAAVIINEALELARTFSTEDAVKFINGMLDAIRKKREAR